MVSALGGLACGAPADPAGDDDTEPGADCPHLAAGTDEQAVKAYDQVNRYRLSVGLSCINFVPTIAAAAADHCAYFVENHGSCIASPHREVSGCHDFVAERFADRLKHADYDGHAAYEVMTYYGDGAAAVDQWVDSIWHRIPILSPYVGDTGYGRAGRCDTMDFAWAPIGPEASAAPVVYPYDQQTGVPTSFDGDSESPAPPRPPKGWPSGYPIMIYASRLTVQHHRILDDQGTAIDHTFIAPGDDDSGGLLTNEFVMYAYRPLKKQSVYRVVVDGIKQGEPLHLEWSFTTR